MNQFLRTLFGAFGSSRPAARRRPTRLGLEQLDERVLPSVTPLGSNFDVTGQTYANQYASSDHTVARAANGNFVVTWDGVGYGGSGIYARLYNANGAALSGPIHVGSTNSSQDFSPTVAMNANGQFAVAWMHIYSSSDYDVRVVRFNANGTAASGELWAAASTRKEYEPSIGMDNAGDVMVAYTYEYSSTDHDVYCWYQSASGVTGTFAVAVSTRNEHTPSLALNASGQGVIAFEYDYSSTDHDIYAQRVNVGSLVGGTVFVASSALNQYDPSAAINAYGNFVVSYTQTNSSSSTQVYAARFNSAGTYLGQVSVGDSWDTRSEYQSSVSLDNYGRFVVAYAHDYSSTDQDVLAQAFDGNGNALSSWFYVAGTSAYDETTPTVTLGDDGHFTVGFDVFGQKPSGYGYNGYSVSAQRFSL